MCAHAIALVFGARLCNYYEPRIMSAHTPFCAIRRSRTRASCEPVDPTQPYFCLCVHEFESTRTECIHDCQHVCHIGWMQSLCISAHVCEIDECVLVEFAKHWRIEDNATPHCRMRCSMQYDSVILVRLCIQYDNCILEAGSPAHATRFIAANYSIHSFIFGPEYSE